MTLEWIGDAILLLVILPVVVYLLRGVLNAANSIVQPCGPAPIHVAMPITAPVIAPPTVTVRASQPASAKAAFAITAIAARSRRSVARASSDAASIRLMLHSTSAAVTGTEMLSSVTKTGPIAMPGEMPRPSSRRSAFINSSRRNRS